MHVVIPTEVPTLEGLLGRGMGKGPASALLLAGPAPRSAGIVARNNNRGAQLGAFHCARVIVLSPARGWFRGQIFQNP